MTEINTAAVRQRIATLLHEQLGDVAPAERITVAVGALFVLMNEASTEARRPSIGLRPNLRVVACPRHGLRTIDLHGPDEMCEDCRVQPTMAVSQRPSGPLVTGAAGVPIDCYDAIELLADGPDHASRLLSAAARRAADLWNDPPNGPHEVQEVRRCFPDLADALDDLLAGGPVTPPITWDDVRPARESQHPRGNRG